MAQMEITRVVPSPEVMDDSTADADLEYLQSVWREAVQDQRPGVAPEPVFRRLREKFAIVPDVRF
jgi:hypothetical protein